MSNELIDGRPRPPSEPSRPGNAPFIPPPTPAPWDPKPAPWQQTQTEAPLDQIPWDRPADATHQEAHEQWPKADLEYAQAIPDPYDADAPVVPDIARQSLAPAWPGWNDPPSSTDLEIEPETPAPWATDSPESPGADQVADSAAPAAEEEAGAYGSTPNGTPYSTSDEPGAVQRSAEPLTHQVVATVPISAAALANGGSPANLVLRIELAIMEDGNRLTNPAPDAAAGRPVDAPEPAPTQEQFADYESAAPATYSPPSFEPEGLTEWPSVWEPAMTEAFAPPASQLGPTVAARRVTPTEEPDPEVNAPDRSRASLLTAGLTVAMAIVVVVLVLVFVQLMTSLLR